MVNTTDVSPFSGSPAMPGTSPNSTGSGPAASGLGLALATSAPAAPATKPKPKPRKRVNTAEKRNQHNAIERQRRETLNGKFVYLARLLPSLAAHRRPSKSAIVNGSIAHLTHQREQRLLAARLLRQLCADRDALAKECAEWRFANGLPARDDLGNGQSAWTEEMEEVCNVEKEQFGTFANMDDGADGEGEGEGEGDDAEDENAAPSSFGGSFSMPSFVHPQPLQNQQQQAGEMSLEQAAAIAAQATFRSLPSSQGNGSMFAPRASADMGVNGNANGSAHALFGSQANNPWSQLSLQDLQAFAAASALTPTGMGSNSTPSANVNMHGAMADGNAKSGGHNSNSNTMFVPPSMSSSTASLPFNAFMSDDSSVSPGSNSGYSQHIPTPPQIGSSHAFISSLPTVQQTPSPQSSHSPEQDNKGAQQQQQQQQQWTEQQLQLLRAIQQQQQQQQQQQPAFNPLSLFSANNAAAAFALGLGGMSNNNGNGSGNSSSPNADSPFNIFASVFPQAQQQQQQQQKPLGNHVNPLYSLGGSNNGNGMGNLPPPPPLTRAQTENLEAWRRISAMPAAYRNSMGMGMSFDQLQQAQARAVEGF